MHVTSRQIAYFSDVDYKLRKARRLRPAKTLALSVACENSHHRCHYHTTCSETPSMHPTEQFSFLSMWNSSPLECCCEQAPKAYWEWSAHDEKEVLETKGEPFLSTTSTRAVPRTNHHAPMGYPLLTGTVVFPSVVDTHARAIRAI